MVNLYILRRFIRDQAFYRHAFLKKRRGYCTLLHPFVRPSVCPLCYLLLYRWTKFNQVWCVSYSQEWGVQQQFFLAPPLGPWRGVKYHLISITKSISKIILPNLVCSYKWKIQNISHGILILLPGSCPRGRTLGRWIAEGVNFSQTLSCGISNRRRWRAEQIASKIFILGSNWWPWGEVKRSIIIKFRLTCQFQRSFYTKLCVCCTKEKWKIQNISDGIFILSPWSCPRDGTLRRWGAQGVNF